MPKMTAEISVVQISLRPIWLAIGAPGSVPGAPSPSSCWLRTPNGSVSEQHDPPQHEVDRERG